MSFDRSADSRPPGPRRDSVHHAPRGPGTPLSSRACLCVWRHTTAPTRLICSEPEPPGTPMRLGSLTSIVGTTLVLISMDASASTGATVEGLLFTLLAVGGVFWLAFAFIGPFRRTMMRLPRSASSLLLFILGAVALSYAAGSAALGKTWFGASVVLRTVEPNWFWMLVKFEAGVGAALLILGFLSPRRPK